MTEQQEHLPAKQEGLTKDMTKTMTLVSVDKTMESKARWNTFKNNTPKDVLTRMYKVFEYTITPAWVSIQPINFPEALLQVPTITNYLKNFKWLRAGVQIRVMINSTTYHQGMMCSSFIHDVQQGAPTTLEPVELSGLNAVYYNYSTSDTALLKYDWTAPYMAMNIADATEGSVIGSLLLSPLVAVKNASGGADNITVTIMAGFTNPCVGGYRQPAPGVAKQSATAEEVFKTQNHSLYGPSSKPFSGVLETVTGIANTIEDLGDLMTGGLLDKPTVLEIPTKTFEDKGVELICGRGASMASKMQLCPTHKLADLEMEGNHFSTKKTWRALAMHPLLHANYDISSPTWTATIQCTPSYLGNENVFTNIDAVTVRDYLDVAASFHNFWRGSIRYHLKVVTSSFVTGRLRITYINDDTPDQYAGDMPNILLDIHGTTTLNITVPYLRPAYMTKYTETGAPKLFMEWVSPPVSSQETPTVNLVVFRAAGPDFQVAGLCSKNPLEPTVQKQSLLINTFKEDFPMIGEDMKMVKVVGITVTEHSSGLSDFFKRYVIVESEEDNPNGVIVDKFLMTTPATFVANDIKPFQYLSSCFKYVRGGARRCDLLPTGQTDWRFVTLQAPGSVTPDAGAGIYAIDPTSNRMVITETPYMSDCTHLNKTLDLRFASIYQGQFMTTSVTPGVSDQFVSFADDRYFFYLLPPPRVIFTANKKTTQTSIKLSNTSLVTKKTQNRT